MALMVILQLGSRGFQLYLLRLQGQAINSFFFLPQFRFIWTLF